MSKVEAIENPDEFLEAYEYIEVLYDSSINVFLTKNAGFIELVSHNPVKGTFPQATGFRVFRAVPSTDWVLKLGNLNNCLWWKRWYNFC